MSEETIHFVGAVFYTPETSQLEALIPGHTISDSQSDHSFLEMITAGHCRFADSNCQRSSDSSRLRQREETPTRRRHKVLN